MAMHMPNNFQLNTNGLEDYIHVHVHVLCRSLRYCVEDSKDMLCTVFMYVHVHVCLLSVSFNVHCSVLHVHVHVLCRSLRYCVEDSKDMLCTVFMYVHVHVCLLSVSFNVHCSVLHVHVHVCMHRLYIKLMGCPGQRGRPPLRGGCHWLPR